MPQRTATEPPPTPRRGRPKCPPGELAVPPAAHRDGRAVEMLRAWIAERGLHCSMNVGFGSFSDPAAWGVLLADVARHVGNAHRDVDGLDPNRTLDRIKASFLAELSEPTSGVRGVFFDE